MSLSMPRKCHLMIHFQVQIFLTVLKHLGKIVPLALLAHLVRDQGRKEHEGVINHHHHHHNLALHLELVMKLRLENYVIGLIRTHHFQYRAALIIHLFQGKCLTIAKPQIRTVMNIIMLKEIY